MQRREHANGQQRHRQREGPLRLARRTLWQAYYQFEKDNGWMMAGHIAFMGLFAIFPFLIFLLALAGFLGQGEAADTSVELGLELLPPDVASALKPAIYEVRNAPHAGLITLGILTTIWVSASGLEALRHALNLAYDVGDPPAFWRTRLESLLLTVLAAVVVIVVMILLVVIPLVLQTVQVLFQRTGVDQGIIFAGARESLGFLLLLGLLMLLYRVLPNVRLRPTEVIPGAVVAWLLWLGAVWGYTIYLRTVPSYSVTYGSLGGIVATLFFFYISALLFIYGAEVNSVLRRRNENRRR
ncbi:MAG TPA: YihY/virulence factor BrkB family protein [Geminicoccaceae bacterium]|nr:YihY/virulence factor BrkB family protein [Geminicoccaceae bacterium]